MRKLLFAAIALVPSLALGAPPTTTTVPSTLLTQPLTLTSPAFTGTSTGILSGAAASVNLDSGAASFGALSQTGTRTWSGGFPGTNNVGVYQNLTLSGTPTGGFAGPEGTSLPINLIYIPNNINYNLGLPGGISALEIQDNYCSGSVHGALTCDGAHNSLLVTNQLLGTSGADAPDYVAAQIFNWDGGNVDGATSSVPLGDFYGLGMNLKIAPGSYAHGFTNEIDFTAASGSVVGYWEGMKWVNFSPGNWTPLYSGAYLRFETLHGSTMPYGITFGDPQVSGGTTVSTSAAQGSAGTTLQFTAGTLTNVSVGDLATGANIPAADAVASVNNGTGVVTLTTATTGAVGSGASIIFGNVAAGGQPISPTGTALYAYSGTMGIFLDGSNVTYSTDFIKGPNGFAVENSGRVDSNAVLAPSSTYTIEDSGGNPLLSAAENGGTTTYIGVASSNVGVATIQAIGNNGELDLKTSSSTTAPIKLIDSGNTVMAKFTDNGFQLPKLSAAPTVAPGAGYVDIFAVAGTSAGTCKLQIIAGTSTTPVTIADNVGSGC